MPTIVGILASITCSRTDTTFESSNTRKIFISQHFVIYERLKFQVQLSMKKVSITLGLDEACEEWINANLIVLYPIPFYNEVCYKETALYI